MATTTVGSQVTYDLIATITATGGPLTFSSIPQTYHSLVVHGAPNFTSAPASANFQFNGDTSLSSYARNALTANSYMGVNLYYTTNTTDSMYNGFYNTLGNGLVSYIFDYTNTARQKSVYSYGASANGVYRGTGTWIGTNRLNAITSITITASNHTTGNVYNLYGLKKV